MSDRVNAGARIPDDIHDLHVKNVREKWGREGVYLGTEADSAIREYLDKDDLTTLEGRLRERVKEFGASTPKIKSSVEGTGGGTKPRAMWRIHPELKEELKGYAKETDNTYSDVFALAIREYWTNSRLDRIEQLVDRLETAIEPWQDQIEGDGVNVTVVDRRTAEIAMELPDWETISRPDIEDAIAEVTSDSEYNREKYTPLVAEYKGLEVDPTRDNIFVTHELAEKIREEEGLDESGPTIFEQSFDDLSSDERVLRVRARGFKKAMDNGGKASMKYNDIEREFDGEPGETTVYNLMGRAEDAAGLEYGEWNGTKQLRVTAGEVDNDVVAAANTENDSEGDVSSQQSVRSELDKLDRAEVVD